MATKEQIIEAAEALVAQGIRPTQAAVRTAVGGGSFTTISEALKAWKAAKTEEHALVEVQVPTSVIEKVQSLQVAVWQSAVAEAEKKLEAEREALHKAQEEAAVEVAEAREAVQTLEAEAEQTQAEIARLRDQVKDAEARIAAITADLMREREQAAELRGQLSATQAQVEALLARVKLDVNQICP